MIFKKLFFRSKEFVSNDNLLVSDTMNEHDHLASWSCFAENDTVLRHSSYNLRATEKTRITDVCLIFNMAHFICSPKLICYEFLTLLPLARILE